MISIQRFIGNPVLAPNEESDWEATCTYNGCLVKDKNKFHLLYRALSAPKRYYHQDMEMSTIGYAESVDGLNFKNRRLLITPENSWEQFGCEDPRVTRLDDKYYIFYTAISNYPTDPDGIKVGLAVTPDFSEITEKHLVTHFNSKAMTLFPQKINGKLAALLSVSTDRPPVRTALAFFNQPAQIWSRDYWDNWLAKIDNYCLDLARKPGDHVEIGAPPIKTELGWLLIYSHVANYGTPAAVWGIEAVLLDLADPAKIIGRTSEPLLVPKEEYERYGKVPNIVFPSGAYLNSDELWIYYGAADTTLCQARLKLADLIEEMIFRKVNFVSLNNNFKLEKFKENPILKPIPEHDWESKYVYNPGAIYEDEQVHIFYRAQGSDDTSVIGLATSRDGLHISERLEKPIYFPREDFETKAQPGYSGCEDPRVTRLDDRLYMCYTAFNAKDPTRIALSSISLKDFLHRNWDWDKPISISSPDRDDKNGCLLSQKIDSKYAFFHRIGGCIWVDYVKDLNFKENDWLGGEILLSPRSGRWDSYKVGIAGPPHRTEAGWLLIYHGLSEVDNQYRLGALLLDLHNPKRIISVLDNPILEPDADYEHQGLRPGTVFSCGSVLIGKKLFVYYGAADQNIAVACGDISQLIQQLKKAKS